MCIFAKLIEKNIMAKTKNDLMSLSDIFRNYVLFRIPNYQRGYSWEKEQREALWEDLENMAENSSHYTGMFTFCPFKEGEYDIVDGQQRMTTLIILINELLNRIDIPIDGYTTNEDCWDLYLFKPSVHGINNTYKFGYRDDETSDVYFRTKILGQHDTRNHLISEDSFYTKNLCDAKSFFQNKIKDYNQERLLNLFKQVTERLKFNIYLVDDPTEVYVTFETMNNRGKNLSTLELLKNRLMYLITLYENRELKEEIQQLQCKINDTWKTIYNFLGKDKKKLNDDTFLRDHWIMYFGYNKEEGFKNNLLSTQFTTKRVLNGKCNITDIDKYVENLNESIRHWYNINCPNNSKLPVKEEVLLTRLNRLNMGSFKPLLMAAYAKRKESDNIEKLLEACERFRFLIFAVSRRRSDTGESHFYTLAHDFFNNNSNTSSISTLTKDVLDKVDAWISIPNFINSAVERYSKKEGFYSWAGLRYFLYEYERSLQEESRDKDVRSTWEIFERNQVEKKSIEHIYPQTDTDSYWVERFTTEQDKKLVHSLGNLLLLSVGKNAEQQNYSFDVKKVTIRDDNGKIRHNGYDEGSHSEIEVAKLNEWTPNTIIERGKKLIKFLLEHWKIDYTFTEEEMNQLLNVSTGHQVKEVSDAVLADWQIEEEEESE